MNESDRATSGTCDDGVVFRAVRASDAPALIALFERAETPCHCRYWHFAGDKNAWLARCAFEPGENARELAAELADEALSPHGVIAARGGEILGWMKLVRAERVPKLYAQRPYQHLPCFAEDRAGVLSMACFLVDPSARRHGISRGLVRAGVELARAHGARAIEAFPRRGELLREDELWTGPIGVFEASGFVPVSDLQQYPVLRLTLAP